MNTKTDTDIFFEHVPALTIWYKAILTWLYHLVIFILILISFWWISSIIWLAALPAVLIMSSISNIPFIYIATNFNKLREKYQKIYKKNPWQHFWYHYSYTSPFGAAALYAPLLLKTDYFLPALISFPSHVLTNTLFPVFIALPLGILLIILALLLIKPSQNHDRDMDIYLYMIYPKESRIITTGIYQYIRHPRFLSRLILAIGISVLANNLLAISAALIHFIPYYACMKTENKELVRRFGRSIKTYQKKVPALFPRYGNWKKFAKHIFTK